MSATTRVIKSRSPPATLRRNRPPIASERATILALIDEDNEMIRYLSERAARRSDAVNQTTALVEDGRRGLAEAEQRLETATSLYEFFLKNNRTPAVLEISPTSPISPTSASNGRRKQFDNLMAIADTYIQCTRMVMEQAALAVEEARDSVALQRDELQAAMTLLMMQHDGYALLRTQIMALECAVIEKKAAFRPIWRVPVEIWRLIFELMIAENEEETALEAAEGLQGGHGKRGCEMLQLSGVCQNWRSLIQSLPVLWSHIHIPHFVTGGDLDRIHHYYMLCDKSRLTITVLSPTMLDVRCFKPLYNLFYTGIPCKSMSLLIRAPGVPALNALLPYLPPPIELSILRYPQSGGPDETERTPTPTIPRSYCGTIRKLYISGAGAQWLDEPTMRLEQYHITAPPVSAIFGPHRFIPSSLQTLTSIGIQGRLYDTSIPPFGMRLVLPNIRQTIMDLNFLATVFIRHYNLPALQKLVIPAGSFISREDWQTFLTEVEQGPGGITEVCCYSFEEDLQSLANCIASLRGLTRLELRGSGVDTILHLLFLKLEQEPREILFPNLTDLVVQSYDGSGHAIICFLEELYESAAEHGVKGGMEAAELPERTTVVALRACRGIAAETRQRLGEFARLV